MMAAVRPAAAILLLAGSAAAVPAPRNAGSSLLGAERQWMDAMRLRDGGGVRRFVAPEFTLSGLEDLSRPPVPAATWIDNALHHLRTDSFRFAGIRAQVSGDVGIVRAGFRWKGAFDGERFDDSGTLVDVWVRRNGRWVVIARVIGAAPPLPPPASR